MAGEFVLLRYAPLTSSYSSLNLIDAGYLAWEYPTNVLLQRLPLGKYSAACILVWGAILCCFAAVKNYPGAIAIRFLYVQRHSFT